VLFAAAIFLGAALLFVLEPMMAKMVLPRFGGAPAVWTTCVLFFQLALLAGYAYAHWIGPRPGRWIYAVHVGLLLLGFLFLPPGVPAQWSPSSDRAPAVALLGLLLISVGVPFVLVSSTAPLLQRWYARQPGSADPYYLYAASNAGSLLGLLAYPIVIEPYLSVSQQRIAWLVGYVGLVLLSATCAWVCREAPHRGPSQPSAKNPVGASTRARWLVLAFVPSSLMLGCTSYLGSDVAAVPLLWVVPLALYLVTFVLCFGKPDGHRWAIFALPAVLVLQVWVMLGGTASIEMAIASSLVTLFVAAMVCHGELARSRPSAEHLTEFYLWLAAGGAIGSAFNALVAPLVFSWIVEYPLALALSAALLPPLFSPRWRMANRLVPLAFAAGILAMFLWHHSSTNAAARVVEERRTFFSVLRVTRGEKDLTHILVHGSIRHGAQLRSTDARQRRLPLLYYFPSGPIGQVFHAFHGPTGKPRVALVGLGIGTLASYADAGQEFTFFEIDPAVADLARDTRYFTFLDDAEARGARVNVVLGDARVSLDQDRRRFGMIVVDAFSGDAIPTHLLTREALKLYLSRLEDNGLIAFHLTNAYLDLEPVVRELAHDLGLVALIQHDYDLTLEDRRRGKGESTWVIMARRNEDLGPLDDSPRWVPLQRRPGDPLWRDDYTNLLRVLR
jgi:hypothetical protein